MTIAAALIVLLTIACGASASPPLSLIDADMMPGVDRTPTSGPGDQSGETRWATFVFRILIRHDGQDALTIIETRLLPSDAIRDLYDGADPFANGGKQTNYGKLALDLESGNELEIKRSILIAPVLSDGDNESLSPDNIARLRAVRDVVDETVFEITFEGGSQRFDLSGLLEQKDWPPFTMVYELEQGQAVIVGDRHVASRQVRRLEYRSASEWTETVLESADIETRVGTFSQTGSYTKLDGRRLTEFDSATGSTNEEEIDEGTRHLPGPGFLPFGNRVLEEIYGITPVKIETGILVCFRDECEDNATGLLFVRESGRERVFADDSRGFPLRFGTSFVARELRVDDARK